MSVFFNFIHSRLNNFIFLNFNDRLVDKSYVGPYENLDVDHFRHFISFKIYEIYL